MPGDANFFFEPYDSEIVRAGEILAILRQRTERPVDYEDFRKEIIERFAEDWTESGDRRKRKRPGFKVAVRVYTTNVDGLIEFDIDFLDRMWGEFDPDRQVHEVTNDLAGLGTGGVIKTEGGLSLLQGGHSHTHGDGHHLH